ncbi:biliverdin-producing heme oxygenase [Vulgatibacter sp.]|uniref:biliverdin-producing heme oxygenase n=1 Tax=Vulgatibacter sp. TaxID=1971226 RepID=UPI0035667B0B
MVRAQIKQATASLHEALEGEMPLARQAPALADYVAHLALLHEVYAPLEPLITPHLPAELRGWDKAPLLRADLLDLGREPEGLAAASIDFCEAGEPFALGCFYVLEGATLGGTVIRRRLASQAPWFADAPRRFLSSEPARWPRFVRILDERGAADPAAAERGARATFAALLAAARRNGG